MNGEKMLFDKKSDEYRANDRDSAIGHMRHLLAKGQYKICPQCGRIYPMEVNYCPQCANQTKLNNYITIKIE